VERLVLVHGSVFAGQRTWRAQAPLAERFELLVLDRPGFPPNPPIERVDFAADARLVANLLTPGDHLVGHSYGGVITLLASALSPELVGSLTVIEPPATRVALDLPDVARFAGGAEDLWASGATADPAAFLEAFLAEVGSEMELPSPLPPELEQGARALVGERGAWEAEIPLDVLRAASFPTRWSSRERTTRRSTRSATRSSASSGPSASSSRGTATRCSGTRGSTTRWRTSSSERPRDQGPRRAETCPKRTPSYNL
jgi:pimeloyl-ACP methyl ester carboxylesterase